MAKSCYKQIQFLINEAEKGNISDEKLAEGMYAAIKTTTDLSDESVCRRKIKQYLRKINEKSVNHFYPLLRHLYINGETGKDVLILLGPLTANFYLRDPLMPEILRRTGQLFREPFYECMAGLYEFGRNSSLQVDLKKVFLPHYPKILSGGDRVQIYYLFIIFVFQILSKFDKHSIDLLEKFLEIRGSPSDIRKFVEVVLKRETNSFFDPNLTMQAFDVVERNTLASVGADRIEFFLDAIKFRLRINFYDWAKTKTPDTRRQLEKTILHELKMFYHQHEADPVFVAFSLYCCSVVYFWASSAEDEMFIRGFVNPEYGQMFTDLDITKNNLLNIEVSESIQALPYLLIASLDNSFTGMTESETRNLTELTKYVAPRFQALLEFRTELSSLDYWFLDERWSLIDGFNTIRAKKSIHDKNVNAVNSAFGAIECILMREDFIAYRKNVLDVALESTVDVSNHNFRMTMKWIFDGLELIYREYWLNEVPIDYLAKLTPFLPILRLPVLYRAAVHAYENDGYLNNLFMTAIVDELNCSQDIPLSIYVAFLKSVSLQQDDFTLNVSKVIEFTESVMKKMSSSNRLKLWYRQELRSIFLELVMNIQLSRGQIEKIGSLIDFATKRGKLFHLCPLLSIEYLELVYSSQQENNTDTNLMAIKTILTRMGNHLSASDDLNLRERSTNILSQIFPPQAVLARLPIVADDSFLQQSETINPKNVTSKKMLKRRYTYREVIQPVVSEKSLTCKTDRMLFSRVKVNSLVQKKMVWLLPDLEVFMNRLSNRKHWKKLSHEKCNLFRVAVFRLGTESEENNYRIIFGYDRRWNSINIVEFLPRSQVYKSHNIEIYCKRLEEMSHSTQHFHVAQEQ